MKNRDFRFRAWHKTMNKMFRVESLDWFFNDDLRTISTFVHTNHDIKDFIIMQYTGIKDKNEKPIFEGDILKAYLNNTLEFEGTVSFRNGCFMFNNWNWIEFLNKFRNYEVVGNIFKNGVKS